VKVVQGQNDLRHVELDLALAESLFKFQMVKQTAPIQILHYEIVFILVFKGVHYPYDERVFESLQQVTFTF
jgi:hypothetical protein